MKRVLAVLVALLSSMLFFGCSNQEETDPAENGGAAEKPGNVIAIKPTPPDVQPEDENIESIVLQKGIEVEEQEEIVFTAKEPLGLRWRWVGDPKVDHMDVNGYDGFNEDEDVGVGKGFVYLTGLYLKNVLKYYKKNIKDKVNGSVHFIAGETLELAFAPRNSISFCSIGMMGGTYMFPYIYESIEVLESRFVSVEHSDKTIEGGTIALKCYFPEVFMNSTESKLRLEFGENYDYYGSGDRLFNYINLYRGDDFVGTCFYRLLRANPKETPTYQWFADFFKNNLILLG